MKMFKSQLIVGCLGLIILGTYTITSEAKNISQEKSGQVVESGAYHLELITEKEKEGVHLDLFLQRGDNHEAIPNAKVTGQVQLPDGKQKSLEFKYDAAGKHYTVLLTDKTPGQYQLKIITDINGEKANGRFSFNQ